jgi:phosphohistidine phosphatase
MILYLMRHGKAARPDPDAPRSLTPGGREQVAQMAARFRRWKPRLDALWHSPKTRAVQTAEILLEALGKPVPREEKKGLKPEGDAREMLEEVEGFKGGSLMLVSHLPFLDELASLLEGPGQKPCPSFPTAGMAAFEGQGGKWKRLWVLDPKSI